MNGAAIALRMLTVICCLATFAGAARAAVGSSQYGIIAPVYDGTATSGGSASFIRLFNGGTVTTTFTTTVVGTPSGRIYGVANYAVPKNASPQKYYNDILTAAGAGPLTGGDTGYAIYVQNLDYYAGYQHVTFNGATTFFENASICARLLNPPAAAGSGVLLNVHTTKLAGWPSKVQIYNSGSAAANFQVSAVDVDTGVQIGNAATIAVGANEAKSMTMAALQTAMAIANPAVNQVNIIVTDPSASTLGAVLGHQVTNAALSADFNLTTVCAANPSLTSPPVAAASTTFQGTIAGVGGQSGTFTVTVQGAVSASTLPASTTERAQALSQATGSLIVSGAAAVALSGTYDSATRAIAVSGGGFALSGSVASGAYAGTYTAPGNVSGVFSSLNTSQSATTLYCGTWSDGTHHGTLNVHIAANGQLTGEVYEADGSAGVTLSGQAVGSSFSGKTTEKATFTGTIQGTTISGGDRNTTFSASVCAAPG